MRRSALLVLALAVGTSPAQAASQWGAPSPVVGVPPLTNVSAVTISGDGTVNAALIPLGPSPVVGVRRSPGGAWSPVAIPADAVGPAGAYRPTAVNRRGDLLTVARASGGPVVFVPAGGGPIVGGPPITADLLSDIRPAVGDGGDAAIAWVNPAGALEVAVRPAATGAWSAATTLASTRPRSPVNVSIGAGGTTIVAWVEPGADPFTTLKAARLATPTGSWETAIAVRLAPNVDVGSIGRRVGVDGAGNAIVVWRETTDANGALLQSATLPAGTSTWSLDPVVATAPLATSYLGTDMSVSADGHAVLAWAQPTTPGNEAVQAVRRNPGGGWDAPATLGSPRLPGVLRTAVADGGWYAAGWDRPAPFPLADTPQGSVAGPAPLSWTAPVDLDAPALPYRNLAAVAITPGGQAVAIWGVTPRSAPGGGSYRISDYGPSSVPAVRAATRVVSVRAATPTGQGGTLGRITLALSQPVENLAAKLEQRVGTRWVKASTLRLNGQTIAVPVPLPRVGPARFRITFTDQGILSVSRTVTIRVTRATRPTVATCLDAIMAQQHARVAWVLCKEPETSTLRRFDLRRYRRVGKPIDVGPGATSISIGGGTVWVARSGAEIVSVDERTGRVDPAIPLGDPAVDSVASIAATPTGVWALVKGEETSRQRGPETLIVVDRGTRAVVNRIALPSPGGYSTGGILLGSRGVWLPKYGDTDRGLISLMLRIDTSGRVVRVPGFSRAAGAGPAGVWTVGGPAVRLDPPRGPRGPDLSRLIARSLVVGPDALWIVGRRGRLGESVVLVRVSPKTGRIVGRGSIVLTGIKGNLDIIAVPGGAWALVGDLGALIKVR